MRRAAHVTALLAVVAALTSGVPARATDDAKKDGKAIFIAERCNACHAVSSAGIESKLKAPAPMGSDLAGTVSGPDVAEWIKYLRKQAQIEGKDHVTASKATDADLQTLLVWLAEQKTP